MLFVFLIRIEKVISFAYVKTYANDMTILVKEEMLMIIKTPTNARKEFYELLKQVNDNHEPIIISGSKSENNAVIVSQEDWDGIQEMLFLEYTGTMDKVRAREKDDSGYTNIDDIDWDNL